MATGMADEPFYEKLTMKQKLFVDAYFANDYNATKAILAAGYKTTRENAKKMGWEMTQKPNIKLAIDARAEKIRIEKGIKPEYLLRKLKQAIERAGQQDNLQAELRAIELAMRHNGMFSEKVEITGKDGEAIKLEQKVKEDAAAFSSAMAGLIKRHGTQQAPSDTEH